MLRGIPAILSPDLMKTLMEMGHGEEIVLSDGNFPVGTHAQRIVRCDGHSIPALLEAILPLFPLDYAVERPVALMAPVEGAAPPAIWDEYRALLERLATPSPFAGIEHIERFAFYERTKQAYAIVTTGERAPRANIVLKKGVVRD
jgi:L-fucose mutarotase